MPKIHLPEPGRPQVLIEPANERFILDLDPATVIDEYKEHGALLLRGFDTDVEQFHLFARQFCTTSVINESPGRRPIDPAHNVRGSQTRRSSVASQHPRGEERQQFATA
jgi:hypothetical protein